MIYECAVCEIRIREPQGNKVIRTSEYNEIDVKLNDLSTMTVGVCSKHKKPTKLQMATMTAKVRDGWKAEVAAGIGNKEWVENVGSKIQIVGLKG